MDSGGENSEGQTQRQTEVKEKKKKELGSGMYKVNMGRKG